MVVQREIKRAQTWAYKSRPNLKWSGGRVGCTREAQTMELILDTNFTWRGYRVHITAAPTDTNENNATTQTIPTIFEPQFGVGGGS
mgnify:CR=1 FL=1